MHRSTRSSRLFAGAATLSSVAALASSALLAAGCGAGGGNGAGGAITVGAALPSPAQLARVSALSAPAAAEVGPGPADVRVTRAGYTVTARIAPNRATTANRLSVAVSRDGAPVRDALVSVTAGMVTMDMGVASYQLDGSGPYSVRIPAWQMPGQWRLALSVTPPGHAPFRVVMDDSLRR